MPRYIFKLTDGRDGRSYYGEWSTVVDAPVSGLFPDTKSLTEYVRRRYGETGVLELFGDMERIERQGVSWYAKETVERLLRGNRAGDGETELTAEQIIDRYKV